MHIHILGICGTFMGGIAILARQSGHQVSGSDQNVYPPMSTQLEEQGIALMQGYHSEHINPAPDCVVVGNVMKRGLDPVEYVLNNSLEYRSGPQWLSEHVLKDKWVIAVAGTHGKTTTASMVAWILEYAGLQPGFLIGGIPLDFGLSARLGGGKYFVVEADEYDTAFFDKRSKFVHYRPKTVVLNNLEFDHADIFPDLAAIQRQFHHLVRIIPGEGLVVANGSESALDEVLDMGCWTPLERFSSSESDWQAINVSSDGTQFDVQYRNEVLGTLVWDQLGQHNVQNALAAIAAARHAGVDVEKSIAALAEFKGVKRRLEVRGTINDITVYDDFAHHPTAIETTLKGLRAKISSGRILAVLEPRSNTMRMGVHKARLADSLRSADQVLMYTPKDLDWRMDDVVASLGTMATNFDDVDAIVKTLVSTAEPGDHILIMSNGGFGGLYDRLLNSLRQV